MIDKNLIKRNNENLIKIKYDITHDKSNKHFLDKGWHPLYFVSATSQILIIGQAPGLKAQESGVAWDDLSGDNLRSWLGVTKEEFYDDTLFGIIPMDFYYPGRGKSGDLPPRSDFADKWHKVILDNLVEVKLIILMGNYALKYYLKDNIKKTLTETVKNYRNYLPTYLPLVHPSPRNNIWQAKNPWFLNEVVPNLKDIIKKIIKEHNKYQNL